MIDEGLEGENENERARDGNTGEILVEVDSNYFRPTEVDILIGDAEKARRELGWKPKVKFEELVRIMVREDLKNLDRAVT